MKFKGIDVLQQNKFLNFYSAIYEDNEKERTYFFASRHNLEELTCVKSKRNSMVLPNAIEAFTYIENENEQSIVMIREFRLPLNGWVYSFPAGLIEKGETAEDALMREVEEEVGGQVHNFKFLQSYPIGMCVGLSDEANMFALVKLNSLSEQKLDEGERIEVVKFTPSELAYKIKNNELKLTASGLLGATILLNKLGTNLAYVFNCDF